MAPSATKLDEEHGREDDEQDNQRRRSSGGHLCLGAAQELLLDKAHGVVVVTP
jgi:hypothetical protein